MYRPVILLPAQLLRVLLRRPQAKLLPHLQFQCDRFQYLLMRYLEDVLEQQLAGACMVFAESLNFGNGPICYFCELTLFQDKILNKGTRHNIIRSFIQMPESNQNLFLRRRPHEYQKNFANKKEDAKVVTLHLLTYLAFRSPARANRGRTQCFICDDAEILNFCNNSRRLGHLMRYIRLLHSRVQRVVVQERIPQQFRADVQAKLFAPRSRARKSQDVEALQRMWREALTKRKLISADKGPDEVAMYRQARRKMKLVVPRHQRGAPVENDTGLPRPSDTKSMKLWRWCRFNSWATCSGSQNMILKDPYTKICRWRCIIDTVTLVERPQI